MDNDDAPVGRILSRREVLGLFGAVGAAFLTGCASTATQATSPSNATTGSSAATSVPATATTASASAPTTAAATSIPAATATTVAALPRCIVSPEMTEGPYFVDEKLERSDIRSDPSNGTVKEGAQLNLTFNVLQVTSGGCTPLSNAMVDIWHCDAAGVYSDVTDRGFSTVGQKFLRGFQNTDANGVAKFVTIYPGWYSGRAVHIHFKIRVDNKEFTSQLFFDEATNSAVFANAPYKGDADVPNSRDGIYRNGGSQLLLTPTKDGDVYNASIDIGMQV